MRKISLVVFLALNIHALAQITTEDFKIQIGLEHTYSDDELPISYVAHDDSNMYILGHAGLVADPVLIAYDKNWKERSSCSLRGDYEGKRTYYQNALLFNGHLLAFFYGIKDKAVIYYYQEVDCKTMTLNKEYHIVLQKELPSGMLLMALGAIAEVYTNPYFFESIRPPFELLVSPDKKMLCVLIRWHERGKKTYPIIAKVFDTEMKVLWEKEVLIPYPVEIFYDTYGAIDSLGNLYIGGAVKVSGEKYIPHVVSFRENGSVSKDCDIGALSDHSGFFGYDDPEDGEITCIGVNTGEKNRVTMKGVFIYRINLRTQKIIQKYEAPVSQELLDKYVEIKLVKDGGLTGFLNIHFLNNGSGIIYVVAADMRGSNTSAASNATRSSNLIIFCLNLQENKSWIRDFSKELRGVRANVASYLPFPDGDDICILYNDVVASIKADNILKEIPAKEDVSKAEDIRAVGLLRISPQGVAHNALFVPAIELGNYLLVTNDPLAEDKDEGYNLFRVASYKKFNPVNGKGLFMVVQKK